MADSCAPLQPPFAAAPACKLEQEENLNHYRLTHSTVCTTYIMIGRKQESFKIKKPFLGVNTSSWLLLLFCFWMLGGGRTLPHLSLSLSLSLCFPCLFPWLESCRGILIYILDWVGHHDDTILSSFLYIISLLKLINRNRKF